MYAQFRIICGELKSNIEEASREGEVSGSNPAGHVACDFT
jgi:hypothetical protein